VTKSLTYVEIDIPVFSYVPVYVAPVLDQASILLHFDDANSPQTIVDDNTVNQKHVWSLAGNAFLDTTDKKFGAASLKCDGAGDYVDTPDNTFDLGGTDFTVDLWFKCNGTGGNTLNICGQVDSAPNTTSLSFGIGRTTGNVIVAQVAQGGVFISVTGTTTFTNSVNTGWHHLAFVRTSGLLKLFLDGIQEGGNVGIAGNVNNSNNNISVGRFGEFASSSWNGWIDEFRISPFARWTANFTPPTTAQAPFNPTPSPSPTLTTYRFALDTDYLPTDIDCIPSIKDVSISPAIISLGENLGQRASVAVTFKDHRHIFQPLNPNDYRSGTFWGKFRAKYGLTLSGYNMRVIRGKVGDLLANMETRHFIIESTDGPNGNGEFKLVGKDALKLADSDRAQAPTLSNGFVSVAFASGATSLTLQPSGVGNLGYPTSGFVNIGGKEICSFTRVNDIMTITRAQFNTTAVAHDIQERVQLCLRYNAQNAATIIADLLVTYADVDANAIPTAAWQAEIVAFLNTLYNALIAEPTSVSKLISELIEQAGLVVWWSDTERLMKLQVLRPVASDAALYASNNYLVDSLAVKEQPEKRINQVYTYFAQINPLIKEDQINNYKSTAYATDAAAQFAYGDTPAIKKIYSRWIADGGRAIADTLNTILLNRFRDPPRKISFDVLRDVASNPQLGVGYQITGWPFQDSNGAAIAIPAQITRINPRADIFEIEAEEISALGFSAFSPDVHSVIIDSNSFNVNLRTMHDSLYGVPLSGQTVQCTINAGISVGTVSTGLVAFDVGTWPAGVTVRLIVLGRIQGAGGNGGIGRSLGFNAGTGTPGNPGSTALYTRQAITLTDASGQIWGGGGGGGGTSSGGAAASGCGGGGAGNVPGTHGGGDANTVHGSDGTATTGGAGGIGLNVGGTGGGPGLAGGNSVFAGGAAGAAIDGISFVTTSGGAGDRRGGQVN
jgi:hypothetical protein